MRKRSNESAIQENQSSYGDTRPLLPSNSTLVSLPDTQKSHLQLSHHQHLSIPQQGYLNTILHVHTITHVHYLVTKPVSRPKYSHMQVGIGYSLLQRYPIRLMFNPGKGMTMKMKCTEARSLTPNLTSSPLLAVSKSGRTQESIHILITPHRSYIIENR